MADEQRPQGAAEQETAAAAAAAAKHRLHSAPMVTNIKNLIPLTLDLQKVQYETWAELFQIAVRAHGVAYHIDGTPRPPGLTKEEWNQLDAVVLSWIYGTISEDLLLSVIKPGSTARESWIRVKAIAHHNNHSAKDRPPSDIDKSEAMGKGKQQHCSEYIPEQVVSEILLRLPATELAFLFRCKLVSKQWKSIISNPHFAQNYLQQKSLGGSKCFQLWKFAYPSCLDRQSLRGRVIKVPLPCHALISNPFSPADSNIGKRIIASSNGLILSSTSSPGILPYPLAKIEFWVSNPVTKQSVKLPLPVLSRPFSDCVVGFTTRRQLGGGHDQAFVTYKVVFIHRYRSPLVMIQIFSSDTGNWTTPGEQLNSSCPEAIFCKAKYSSKATVSCNSVLHWFDRDTRIIVTYDPYGSPDRFGFIPFPTTKPGCVDLHFVSDSEDVLKFGEMEILGRKVSSFNVWGLSIAKERALRVWRLVDRQRGEWWLEKVYVTREKRVRDELSHDIPNPALIHHHIYGYLFTVSSDPSMVMALTSGIKGITTVPVVACPWSSPFFG